MRRRTEGLMAGATEDLVSELVFRLSLLINRECALLIELLTIGSSSLNSSDDDNTFEATGALRYCLDKSTVCSSPNNLPLPFGEDDVEVEDDEEVGGEDGVESLPLLLFLSFVLSSLFAFGSGSIVSVSFLVCVCWRGLGGRQKRVREGVWLSPLSFVLFVRWFCCCLAPNA